MAFLRFPPPPTLRISTRLPGALCGFCGCDEDQITQFWTGRIMRIQHKRKTICEACIEYADEQAEAARLARQPRKPKRGAYRPTNRHAIGRPF